MKKIYNILILIISFILLTWIVYATVTVASSRKSYKLPWQWIKTWFYNSAHNVWANYLPEARFSFNTWSVWNWVVLDSVTWLYWQSNWITQWTKTWEDAKTYCANLILGWFTDWRLPSYIELSSILDLSKITPSINTIFFTSNNEHYWSSTTRVGNNTYAWVVNFDYSGIYYITKITRCYVRCLR